MRRYFYHVIDQNQWHAILMYCSCSCIFFILYLTHHVLRAGVFRYSTSLCQCTLFTSFSWTQTGSNRWPPECKSGALPAELIPLIKMVGRERLELSTPPLSRVCSNQLSYRPFCWMNSFTNIRDKEEKRGRLQCTMLSDSSKVNFWTVLRKEVIQPQVPLRLPCYDFTPVADYTLVKRLLAVSNLL